MKNQNDKQLLQELASVIDRLDKVLSGLKNPNASSANTHDSGTGLVGQWQKLFTGKATPAEGAISNEDLAIELEQQMVRLHNSHSRLERTLTLDHKKLSEVATQFQQSGMSPPASTALLEQLSRNEVSHHGQLWRLLDYYQEAINICVEHNAEENTQQHSLCSRLQHLVEELHFSGPLAVELTKVRRQLLEPIESKLLPSICLRLVNLTIEGLRFERKTSKQFLTNLHTNLEEVHQYAAITLSEEQSLCDARTHHGHHIAGELRAIGEHLFGQDNAQLKAAIEVRMRSINHILLQNERLQEREQALLKRMVEMEQQIHVLKGEADQFRQQLDTQNDKLFLDALTQIHNRAGMDQRLEVEYRQWLRDDKPLCIALLDIDFFKEVNDKYGHLAGDKALRLIAKTLKKSLRESDFIARFGGEEFMVLLNNVSLDYLDTPLQKLREQVKNIPFRFKEESVTITISMGATLFKQGDSILSALERADQALYRAKQAGRDQIVIG